MPAMANIVLADAQGTPVNHTFVPIGRDEKEVFWFEDKSAAAQIGNWRISMQIKRPPAGQAGTSSKDRTHRIVVGLHEPILETVSNNTVSGIAPAPTLAYVPRTFREYILPERSSLLDRQNLRKMAYNLDNNSQVIAIVEQLEYLFA